MRTYILALLLAVVPLTVQAQDTPSLKIPMTLFAATATSDWASTAYCVSSPYCHEANPLFAWAGERYGTATMITLGASSDVLAGLILRRVGVHHPRVAATTLYATSALRVYFTAHNARLGYRLHQPCPLSDMFCR